MAEAVMMPPTGNVVQPTTLVLQPHPVQKTRPNYRSKASSIIGIIQISAGVIILVLFGLSYLTSNTYDEIIQLSTGCQAAISFLFFCLSGGFAIGAANRRTSCLIVANMVMAIIASVAALCLFSLALVSCLANMSVYDMGYYDPYYEFDQELYDMDDVAEWPTTTTSAYRYLYDYESGTYPTHGFPKAYIAVFSFIMLLSLVEFVAAIWSSSLACRVMCCSRTTNVIIYGNIEAGQRYIVTRDGHAMLAAPANTVPPIKQEAPITEKTAPEGEDPPPYE